MSSSPSTTATASASASTPTRAPTAFRPWSRCARACDSTSLPSARTWPPALSSATTTARTTCPRTQTEIAFLGIEDSPSFVREPEGNGVAERFIRTLKENLLWVRHFETIEELRLALLDFAGWYNTHWLVARHGHRTPAQVRADQQLAIIRPHDRRSCLSHNRGAVHRHSACIAAAGASPEVCHSLEM